MTLVLSPDQALAAARGGGRLNGLPVLVSTPALDAATVRAVDALITAGAVAGVELPVPLARVTPDSDQLRSARFLVFDARASLDLTDELRYLLRTAITDARASNGDLRVGIELPASIDVSRSFAQLAPYVDFVIVSEGAAIESIANAFPGVWTAASARDRSDVATVITVARAPSSLHVVFRVPAGEERLAGQLAELREMLPAGLTPLPDVTVACEGGCDAAMYLHPETLDAVALVRPLALVNRVVVSPGALELATYGDVHVQARGREMQLPAVHTPFVLRIKGWRGVTEEAFATGVQVSGTRQLRVEEIVARHQAAGARQQSIIKTLISHGETVLTFRVPGFAGPLAVTARTVTFTAGDTTEIEQDDIHINGLSIGGTRGEIPRLPLVEPERVSTPPLTITLTDAYRYALRGRERVHGRDAYVVVFDPIDSKQSLFSGTAWIDAATFGLARVDATQTQLRGPIASSRQIDEFGPTEVAPQSESSPTAVTLQSESGQTEVRLQSGSPQTQVTLQRDSSGTSIRLRTILWLPRRTEVFQVYQGPTESTPIRRTMTYTRHEVNATDFAARLEAAHRSDAVMLRDTPQGYRFLVRAPSDGGARARQIAPDAADHVATAVVGSLFDPNISVPLVFAGVSYVDFNFLRTGSQLNAFAGGTYGRVSWSTPPLFGAGWRLAGDGAAVAVSYNDRAIAHGIERYAENVRQRPAQFSVALAGPVAPAVRVRASYDLAYTAYSRSDSTAATFVVPPSTPVHAARFTAEAERGPWNATVWWSLARRQRWTPWGLQPDGDHVRTRVFERYGATLTRSFVWSRRAVGHVEAAWMAGRRLDRFSQFAFGTFDNTLRGYPVVSIRYPAGAALRSVATWNASSHVRLDGFGDIGFVRAFEEDRWRGYPGIGAAAELPAGFGWLLALEWGYGIKGLDTNGREGTHVVRVSAYKIF